MWFWRSDESESGRDDEAEVLGALERWGDMHQRHIRSGTSLGVEETGQTLEVLERRGLVERVGDLWRKL